MKMTNTTSPFVSLAIPTYNRADSYLKESLKSAINQTYQNIEIIVSDNCSTDNTERVVKDFKDPRIRYFKQTENIGPYKNFNFCLQQATGTYFLILSDDDLIDRDFIDICIKSASYATDVGVIRTGTRVIDSHGVITSKYYNDVLGLPTEDLFRGWFASKTAFSPCSSLFNTEKLKEIGGFKPENNLFHDGFVIAKLAAKYERVDVKEIKASFRKHQSEISHTVQVKDWCEDSLLLLDEICGLVSEKYRVIVRKEGIRFFTYLNYYRAKAIKSPIKCLRTYFMVYRKFDYVHSPLRHVLREFLYTPMRSLVSGLILRGSQFVKKLV